MTENRDQSDGPGNSAQQRRSMSGIRRRSGASRPSVAAADEMTATAADASGRQRVWLAAGVVVLAGLLAYANSFQGQFYLDDDADIRNGELLRRPFPPWRSTAELGTRPAVWLTFWADYQCHGLSLPGYHAVNLAIHLLAALTLMGLVRRTLLMPRFAGRFDRSAWLLAGATALLWAVHPLCTSAVTYISQRAEAMMGLFYLLTLYVAARGLRADRPAGWLAASVAACAVGMVTKEVMATAPVMVLLYDRLFVSDSFGQMIRRRWGYYLALAATWIPLAALLANATLGETVGFGGGKLWTIGEYLRTQPLVILHYLYLSVVPVGLRLDYGWGTAKSFWEIVPPALAVLAMLAASMWAIRRRSAWGFLGAWFLLILAPTSSFMPIADMVFEHRMYLPLAAVVVAMVIGLYLAVLLVLESRRAGSGREPAGAVARPMAMACLVAAAVALAGLTFFRNADYCNPLQLWSKNAALSPLNGRVFNSLGCAWNDAGEVQRAHECVKHALELQPDSAEAMVNAGVTSIKLGAAQSDPVMRAQKFREAQEWCVRAIQTNPRLLVAHGSLGSAREMAGDYAGAEQCYRQVLNLSPANQAGRRGLINVLARQGSFEKWPEAMQRGRELARDFPADPACVLLLARLLAVCPDDSLRDGREALTLAEAFFKKSRQPLSKNGEGPVALDVLALALAETGKFDEAIAAENQALDSLAGSATPEETRDYIAHLDSFRARRAYRGYP